MTGYRQGHMEKVCRGCGRVYDRQFRRNSGWEDWCGGSVLDAGLTGEACPRLPTWQPASSRRAARAG